MSGRVPDAALMMQCLNFDLCGDVEVNSAKVYILASQHSDSHLDLNCMVGRKLGNVLCICICPSS